MTTKQENEYSRNVAVANYLNSVSAQLSSTPHFTETVAALQVANLQTDTFGRQLLLIKKDAATNKEDLRANIKGKMAEYIRKIKVYGTFENKTDLLGSTKAIDKVYKSIADSEFINLAKGLVQLAEDNITGLATYDITVATQTELENLIQDFEAIVFKPREILAGKKQINSNLNAAFAVATAQLKKSDMILEMVKTTKPDVYDAYKVVRKLVNSGTGLLSLKALVIDVATKQPLQGVSITIDKVAGENGPVFETIKKKTAKAGGFNLKGLPEGTYQLTADYPAYVSQQLTIYIYEGQKTNVNIKLQRA